MGCVYFVRHGQTIWNVENKICGATDIALTKTGHEQAVETGKKILEEGIQADEILHSPLIRARDTALHISEITGIPAREEPRLTEQNFGDPTSLAPHERLPDLAVVPREKPHTGAAAREQPRDSPVIER